LGVGVLGFGPKPPIPNPQSPIPNPHLIFLFSAFIILSKIKKYKVIKYKNKKWKKKRTIP
jgi:hypothetical protein